MALNDKFSSTNGPDQDDKSFNTCSECGMAFEMSSRLSQHLLQHSSVPLGLEQRCPIADENCTELTFSAFTELSDHLEKKHPLWSIKRRTIDDTNGNKHSTPEPSTSKTCMQEICALNDDNKQRQRSQWYRNSLNNNNNYAAGENLDDFFIDRDNHNGNDSDNDNDHNLPALRNKLLRDTLAALARSDFGLNLSMLMNGNANISGDLSNARMFKCGADLWRMIEGDATVGKLRLLDEFADYKTSIENISSESLATVLASKCHSCNFLASDIWTLREHVEKVHGQNFLDESIIEQMINRLNDAISQTSDTKHHNNNGELKRKRESRSSSAESVSRKRGRVGSPDTVAVEPAATNDLLEAQQSLTKILMSNFFAESMKSAAQNNSISYLSNITSDGTLSSVYAAQKNLSPNSATSSTAYDTGNSPAKRARTRITDEQLKILRQYFDINNSPSEEKIKEMSVKAQLPEKVIKHWFRNTLFKERQRDKDSPYNFSIPPQMSIDLAVYEKTGEAKITPIEQQLKAENLNSSVDGSCSIAKTEDPVKKSPSEELSDVSANESAAVSPFAEKLLDSRSQSVAYENGDYDIDKSDNRTPQIRNYEDFVAELTRISGLSDSATGSAEDGSELDQEQPPSLNFTTLLNGLAGTDPAALSAMLANSVMSSCVPNLLMIPPDLTATASINNVSSSANLSDTRITSPTVAQGAISCGSTAGLTVGSGRRANRTRFTDFQLRTLQNFFDRQAYPKDDDLEMLSKKLGLSPRVIVVWFQNARQKARKISENHGAGVVLPAGAGGGGTLRDGCLSMLMEGIDETDSLVSLPPFQCRKCATVFPLHVDLVQHYQKGCFGAENSLLLGDRRDNTPTGSGVNMFLNPFLDGFLTASKTTKTAGSPANNVNRNDTRESEGGPSPAGSQQPTVSTSEGEEGETERMLQYFLKMIGQTNGNSFYTMQSFINDNGNNAKATNDKIDSKNVGGRTSPLDLSVSTINGGGRFSPNNNDVELMTIGDDSDNLSRTVSTSPYAPPTSSSNLAQMSDLFSQFVQQQRQQSQQLKDGSYGDSAVAACAAAAAAAANNSKRYRTHLTPLQVYIMKALFNDYKTPSMSECDALGHQIGLHKRVVQVWFQNARAKERKSRGGLLGVDASAVDDVAAVNLATGEGAATRCELCEIDLADASIQDHIFTSAHIQRVRTQGVLIRAAEGTSDKPLAEPIRPGSAKSGQRPYSPTSKPNTSFSFNKWPYKSTPNLSAESFFDHNLMGTPIVMLQIPESVMRQISADLASGRGAAHFTQDGLELAQLRGKISEDDFKQTTTVESEVGWACPECMNVFQHESLLQNHQRIVCQNSSGIFRLVQTHYLCKSCSCKTGTQDEFRAHCKSNFHVAAKRNEIQSTGYVATTAKPTPT